MVSVQIVWDNPQFEEEALNLEIKNELYGQNIFFARIKNANSLKEKFPAVENFDLSKQFPAVVSLKIITRRPIIAVINDFMTDPRLSSLRQASDSSVLKTNFSAVWQDTQSLSASPSAYLLDKTGIVFKEAALRQFKSLPRLFLLSGVDSLLPFGKLKSRNDPDFFSSVLSLFSGLVSKTAVTGGQPDLPLTVEYILYRATGDLAIKFSAGFYAFLPEERDYQRTLEILNLIVGKYSTEGKNLKKIDLRFKNPVVEY